jgi:hypothetical protein
VAELQETPPLSGIPPQQDEGGVTRQQITRPNLKTRRSYRFTHWMPESNINERLVGTVLQIDPDGVLVSAHGGLRLVRIAWRNLRTVRPLEGE